MLRLKSKHRLMCGDSSDVKNIEKLLDGSRVAGFERALVFNLGPFF